MTSGTKIALVMITLFIGVLVWYYGWILPSTDPVDEVPLEARVLEPEADAAGPDPTPPPDGRRPTSPSPSAPPSDATARAGAAVPPFRLATAGTETEEAELPVATTIVTRPPIVPPALPETLPDPPAYTEYVVRSGDTMSSIARAWFGSEREWERIARANLVDPARLRVGQVLRLPPRDDAASDPPPSPPPAAPSRAATYRIRAGDTLSTIAAAQYGDPTLWQRIWDHNRATIGGDPDRLVVGMEIELPE